MSPKIIAFDADDTLWHNEPYFDEAQAKFCELFQDFASKQEILQLILNHQVKNLPLYGFGIKAFTLSMTEAALELTNHQINGTAIEKIINIGKDLLQKPVELLPNVTEVLEQLKEPISPYQFYHEGNAWTEQSIASKIVNETVRANREVLQEQTLKAMKSLDRATVRNAFEKVLAEKLAKL
mgnify:CR=1 FL=1